MDRFIVRSNKSTPPNNNITPPPSPAEPTPPKKAKLDKVKILATPLRPTSVDWERNLSLDDDRNLGFTNSQGEFENLYFEDPTSPSTSTTTTDATTTPTRRTQSLLSVVRQGIFTNLQQKHGQIEFNFDTYESTDEYKKLMKDWELHFNKFKNIDPWKAASPPGFIINHEERPVGVKYENGRLFANVQKKGVKFSWRTGGVSKCRQENCGSKSNINMFCDIHTTMKREILLVRDVTNLDERVMALLHPQIRKGRFTDLSLNEIVRGAWYSDKTVGQYVLQREEAWFVIENRWESTSETSVEKYQTLEVQFSLMASLYNDITLESSHKINFLNGDILCDSAKLVDVKKGLELNNMGFKIGDQDTSLKFKNTPLISSKFDNKLPFVYVGDDEKGGYRFGEDHSVHRFSVVKGSKGHLKETTTMAGIKPENKHNVFQADPSKNSPEEMLQKSLEVETLGHQGVLVAQMLDMDSVNGNKVKNKAKKFTHFNNGWDDTIFSDIVMMMTGRRLIVNKSQFHTESTTVKVMVPIYKTVGEKAKKVLDTDKMKNTSDQSKIYDKIVIRWM